MLRVFNPVSNKSVEPRSSVLQASTGRRAYDRLAARSIVPSADINDDLADRIAEKLAAKITVNSGSDVRMNSPGVRPAEPVYLQRVLELCFERHSADCTDSSWSGYRTLVKKWNAYWSGRGPDLRNLTRDHLQAFFEGVEEWHSERSWNKNRDLLYKLLKSACPLSIENDKGMERGALLQKESLPVWEVPRDRWFVDREATAETESEHNGGHRPCQLPLLTSAELGKILTACKSATFLDPLWWECWFCQVWFHGPRWQDFWRFNWNGHESKSRLRIDLKSATIHVKETKAGGNGTCPMPSWLFGRLALLKSKQNAVNGDLVYVAKAGSAETLFAISPGDAQNRERRFRPQYMAIWEAAGVPVRHPHQMRGVAISNWISHAPTYRFAAIGHSPPKSDVQLRNYATFDQKFIDAAETFPFPDQHRRS